MLVKRENISKSNILKHIYVNKCTSVVDSTKPIKFIGFYVILNIILNQIHNLKSTLELTTF